MNSISGSLNGGSATLSWCGDELLRNQIPKGMIRISHKIQILKRLSYIAVAVFEAHLRLTGDTKSSKIAMKSVKELFTPTYKALLADEQLHCFLM